MFSAMWPTLVLCRWEWNCQRSGMFGINNLYCLFFMCKVLPKNRAATPTSPNPTIRLVYWNWRTAAKVITTPCSSGIWKSKNCRLPIISLLLHLSWGKAWEGANGTRSLRKIESTAGYSFTIFSLRPCIGLKSPENYSWIKDHTSLSFFLFPLNH